MAPDRRERVTTEEVGRLAQMVGLELDDSRAEVIAARLSAVLAGLESIPSAGLATEHPLLTFAPVGDEPATRVCP